MTITGFDHQIITKDAENAVQLFEALGFALLEADNTLFDGIVSKLRTKR